MKYKSIIGFGRAAFIDDPEQKCRALDVIMQQYSEGSVDYPEEIIKITTIVKVEIESMTGKQSG